MIFAWEGKCFVRDLWSRSGTFVNGKSVHEQELMPGDVIRCGETDITYAPSLEEAAFAVVEGASDSIVADSPKADEVDLGLELEPHTEPAAPMEVIVPPMTPPRQEELLESEPLESGLIESSAHDTAHVPLALDIDKPAPAPQASTLAQDDSDLPKRGCARRSRNRTKNRQRPT